MPPSPSPLAPGPGVTAGVLSPALPKECTGLNPRACYACQDLKPAAATECCIKCAKAVQPPAMETFFNGAQGQHKG